MSTPPRRARWYCFLYRILGAHLAFWAWILALTGIWFTWREASLYALNVRPIEATVAQVSLGDIAPRRWIEIHGVEVIFHPELFPRDALWSGAPDRADGREPRALAASDRPQLVRVLLDPSDDHGAGRRLRDLALLAYEFNAEAFRREDGRALELFEQLQLRISQLFDDPEALRSKLLPNRALLLLRVEHDSPPELRATVRPATGIAGSQSLLDRVNESTLRRIQLIRACVRTEVTHQGVLEDVPEHVREAIFRETGVPVVAQGLEIGRAPRETFYYAFVGFAALLFFLIVGYAGLPAHEPPGVPAPAASPAAVTPLAGGPHVVPKELATAEAAPAPAARTRAGTMPEPAPASVTGHQPPPFA